ncbi:hypothetical protein BJ878DRAFT_87095 [Calycina marina]|uniref:Uncharacterized protein n=1 Tax=Calycina marina TaxID=1763456 RepID=A0A9P7Z274_9HELO|nr:hypothetical protein BJ878DRAFT_87095 [Calycina marina]
MGHFESLVTWALGRSPYETELIRTTGSGGENSGQMYNSQGRPRRPETRERERDQIRAANEVIEATGLIENHIQKDKNDTIERLEEAAIGMHLMNLGRAVLFPGVWGTMNLRRRMLLYRSYSNYVFPEILQHETASWSITARLFSGLPAIAAYYTSGYANTFLEDLIDEYFGLGEDLDTSTISAKELWIRNILQATCGIGFTFLILNLDMFASLKQVGLVPASRNFPSLMSFIPFSSSSPLQLPTPFSLTGLFASASPILTMILWRQTEAIISKVLYRPVYRSLPRPVGGSMFEGLDFEPGLGYDAPDRPTTRRDVREDAETLRALEGRSEEGSVMRVNSESRPATLSVSDDEASWQRPRQAFSLDVEATVNMSGGSDGQWVAELRNANEPTERRQKYRITGMTILPVVLAAEALRDVVVGIFLTPIEAATIRVIGLAYRRGAGLDTADIPGPWDLRSLVPIAGSLFGTYALQVIYVGSVWAAYTFFVEWLWFKSEQARRSQDKFSAHEHPNNNEMSESGQP